MRKLSQKIVALFVSVVMVLSFSLTSYAATSNVDRTVTISGIGLLEFTSATYTLSPSTRPTSITLNMTLQFQIWTDATGPNPVTYSESHSHTTKVSNIYN